MRDTGEGYCSRCGRWLPLTDLIVGEELLSTPFGATRMYECVDGGGCAAWQAESKQRREVLAEQLDHRVLYQRRLFARKHR